MRKRWLSKLTLALVPCLSLSLLTPAWAETPAPTAKPFLGIGVEGTPKDVKQAGAIVREVAAGSPAAKAGLKQGDLIYKVGTVEVKDPITLVDKIAGHKPGEKLTLHLLREGKDLSLEVTLTERPAVKAPAVRAAPAAKSGAYLGVWSQELTPALKNHLGLTVEKGALVMEVMPASPATRAGLKADDVITGVDDQSIANPAELRDAVQKMDAGKEVTLKVMRGKEMKEIKVKLEAAPLGFGGRPGLDPELRRHFEEMQKWLREFEQQLETPSR